MKLRDLKISTEERNKRFDTCKRCKFFVAETGTCGQARWKGKGEEVTYRRKKVFLCGCVMKIKTCIPWAMCPIGKWGVAELFGKDDETTKQLAQEARSLLNRYDGSKHARQELIALHDEITAEQTRTNCGACISRYKDDLHRFIREVENC